MIYIVIYIVIVSALAVSVFLVRKALRRGSQEDSYREVFYHLDSVMYYAPGSYQWNHHMAEARRHMDRIEDSAP